MAHEIDGKNIKDGSIPPEKIKPGSLTGREVANNGLDQGCFAEGAIDKYALSDEVKEQLFPKKLESVSLTKAEYDNPGLEEVKLILQWLVDCGIATVTG